METENLSYNKFKKIPRTRLKELREKNDMTKSYLADMLGRTIAAVSHHETLTRGMTHANVMRYCGAFRCYSYEIYDTTDLPSYLEELRIRSRLTNEEIAKTTGISKDRVILHMANEEPPRHGEIVKYARLFKVFTHQLFVKVEYTPDTWTKDGELPLDLEEKYADPILYNQDGLIAVDNSLSKKSNRMEGRISGKTAGRLIPHNMHPDTEGKRQRRVRVDQR